MAKNPEPENDQPKDLADAIDAHLDGASGQGGSTATNEPAPARADTDSLRKRAAERDEFLSLLQHTRADFANYQKRVQKEIESTRRFACQPLVADLLPGLDNLERALSAADANSNSAGLLDGLRMVHQQLQEALGRHGVRAIEAMGKPFDPDFHEALMEQADPTKPPRTVIQELQRGYRLHDRIIRPARVIVSKADGQGDSGTPTNQQ